MLGHLNIADVVARLHLCFGLTPRILVFLTITGNKSWESWLRSSRSTHPSCSPSKITLWTEPIKHGLKSSKQVILWMEPIKHALPLEKWPLKNSFQYGVIFRQKKTRNLKWLWECAGQTQIKRSTSKWEAQLTFYKSTKFRCWTLKRVEKRYDDCYAMGASLSLSRSPCLFLMHTQHIYSYTIHM